MFLKTMVELVLGRRSVSVETTIARRQSGHRELAIQNEARNREFHQMSKRHSVLHRGLFDPLFSGLSNHAVCIDAAILRRACLR